MLNPDFGFQNPHFAFHCAGEHFNTRNVNCRISDSENPHSWTTAYPRIFPVTTPYCHIVIYFLSESEYFSKTRNVAKSATHINWISVRKIKSILLVLDFYNNFFSKARGHHNPSNLDSTNKVSTRSIKVQWSVQKFKDFQVLNVTGNMYYFNGILLIH